MALNFQTRLKDQWNLRALTHTQTEGDSLEHGCPREQGHYAFMLTDMFLLPLMVGQENDIANGKLTLNPRYPPPYVMPVALYGCVATIQEANAGEFVFTVVFGKLTVAENGLSVNGKAYPHAAQLSNGDSVAWS